MQPHDVDRDDRQRPYGAGRAEATWGTLADQRLFIFYDVTVYPWQARLACALGRGQSPANAWMPLLRAVLQQALAHGGSVPARAPKQLGIGLASAAAATSGIDGTARPRQRPRDAEKPKHYDRGKKKHTRSSIACLAASI